MVLALRRRGLARPVHLRLLALTLVRVSYFELRAAPAPAPVRAGSESIAIERLDVAAYLALYRRIGEAVRWDQRLNMPSRQLEQLLAGQALRIHVLRGGPRGDAPGEAIGLCEFDHQSFPDVELKNFGVVPEAQGRGLGRWLLSTALDAEWRLQPDRIWLHTDTWDHPAAKQLYRKAGFQLTGERDEPAAPL